jgi:hypothetical protein
VAIRGLKPATITQFLGKNTAQNMTDATDGTLLSAVNVMILADNQMRRAPGYTLVAKVGTGPIYSTFDFERNVDGAQFVFVHSGASLYVMNADGTNIRQLSTGETSEPFVFVQNSFICYASNGVNAYRFVDFGGSIVPGFVAAGVLTRYQWGINAPLTAPAISLSAGALTLTWGRNYVLCFVSQYTDSLGIVRVHVGPPSPLSAFSGPISAQAVNLTALATSTDPQVNFVWIFATTDGPINTSATLYFAAALANGTTTWADTLLDSKLDQTKVAPYNNNPAPPSRMLTTFQNRVAAIQTSQLRLSGYGEITLGIPEESWPLELFFNIPAGSRLATGISTLTQGSLLAVDTLDAVFGFTGSDESTFTEEDRIAMPGMVGKFAWTLTPWGRVYISESKRLFIWSGTIGTAPTEISAAVAQSYAGTYGMNDLSAIDLKSARIVWYSYGVQHYVIVLARTTDAPDAYLNWMQIWSIPVKGGASTGQYSGSSSFYNQIAGIYQTDKIPNDSFSSASIVKVASVPYVFLGGPTGNVYRFPDGYQDNGQTTLSSFSGTWTSLGTEAEKRFYWLDLYTTCDLSLLAQGGPLSNFKMWAAVGESAEDPVKYTLLDLQLVPNPKKPSQYALRGNLQVDGLNVGRYIRIAIQLPADLFDSEILKATIWHAPLYEGAP